MATPDQKEPSLVFGALKDEPFDAVDLPQRSRWRTWLLRLVLLLLVLGAAAAGGVKLVNGLHREQAGPTMTHTVQRGDLRVTVIESGSLESAENVDIKCEVAGGSKILWVIDDGKEVEKGAELMRLDTSKLDEDLSQQKITYEKARASQIQAEKDYAVAKIAVQEYVEGTFRKELQDLESKVTVAMENLRNAENSLQHAQRMLRKGYISQLQLETQQFAVERSKLDLGTAKTARDVLERFTRAKMVQDLESKRDAAEAKMRSEKAALELEEMKLKRKESQIAKCTIRAPKAGMVIYASVPFWRDDAQIKQGTQVNDQQTVLLLPDLSKMQAKVRVHESKVAQVRPGMPAVLRIQDRKFEGSVLSVANQPAQEGWLSERVKKFETIVRIDGKSKDLRPGLTAEVEILVNHLKDILSVPVAAVCEHEGKFLCYVKKGDTLEKRVVVPGISNDKSVEIKSGLAAGDEVSLTPVSRLGEAGKPSAKPKSEEQKPEQKREEKPQAPAKQ
ncbi:MAG: HlyD family efflux transporter periplasmic adaptor subunit [Thermoguttaceae bacterium]|jgi:multidrug resistance efflux pump